MIKNAFGVKANYYYSSSNKASEHYLNDYSCRIGSVMSWAVTDASGEDMDVVAPGIYIDIPIGERHSVTLTITEENLLKALEEINRVKKTWNIRTTYHFDKR